MIKEERLRIKRMCKNDRERKAVGDKGYASITPKQRKLKDLLKVYPTIDKFLVVLEK